MKIPAYGLRLAAEHPVRTVRLGSSLFGIAVATRRGLEAAKRVATDQTIHSEAERALMSAVNAARRARQVGAGQALTDKKLAKHVRHASEHASRAVSLAVAPRRSAVKTVVVVVLGSGAVAGAVYGGRRMLSSRSEPAIIVFEPEPVSAESAEPEPPEETEAAPE